MVLNFGKLDEPAGTIVPAICYAPLHIFQLGAKLIHWDYVYGAGSGVAVGEEVGLREAIPTKPAFRMNVGEFKVKVSGFRYAAIVLYFKRTGIASARVSEKEVYVLVPICATVGYIFNYVAGAHYLFEQSFTLLSDEG